MPGQNLTRSEARERSSLISVESYEIHLDLSSTQDTFRSESRVKFDSSESGASTFIDCIAESVTSIVLNGQALDIDSAFADSRILLSDLQTSNELTVIANAKFMNTGEGLHRFVDPVDNETYLYTQFEVPDSRRVFAVFEQPDLKATFQFNVTAPSHWKVVSNQASPEAKAIDSGKSVWNFAPTPRISSYITAIIAGPYTEVKSELTSLDGRVIPLGVFCRSSLTEFLDADYIFEKTRQGFEFFEKAFQRAYPFEKYDQLFVPEFNAGAMENAGAVTFTEVYVFRSKVTEATRERRVVTILHELAHMWFGDLVTMKWWNDLWLNESFAEYASTLATAEATEYTEAWTTFTSLEKSWAYRQDQLPSTHPIVAEINDLEDVQVNFDGITYAKGASVLKQLVAWVGQEKFLAGVAAYFKKHEFGNTELEDLLVELEAQSGRELRTWSKLWLETAGVNTLRPSISVNEVGLITSFAIEQTAIAEHPTLRPHRLAVGFYNMVDGRLIRTDRFELDIDGPSTAVREIAGKAKPALILLNDDDLAYAKVRLDEHSLKFALDNLGKFDSSIARTLIWGSIWDATRDAEVPARDFVRLVLNSIEFETESTTRLTLLRQLTTAVRSFVANEHRASTLKLVADRLLELAKSAAAGSDAQFQFVRFFAQFASSPKHFDALEALLGQSLALEGLEIDADLKWELITGLVVGGRIDQAGIDRALAADNTASGQKAAAGARAAIGLAASKAAVWHELVETQGLSNTLLDAASLNFGRVLDQSLIEPYVELYFNRALHMWNSNTFKIADYLLVNLYPVGLASVELAAKTRQFIERPEIAEIPALRRILVENLANVDRALAAQALDSRG